MSELETVAERKKTREAATKKKGRAVGKSIGVAGVIAAGAAGAYIAQRVQKTGRQIIVPQEAVRGRQSASPSTATREKFERLITNSLSTHDAAKLLTSSATAITRQIRSRALYGFTTRNSWLLPKFQFCGTRAVRDLDKVLPRLNPGLHPIEVVNWFTTPHPDLVLDQRSVSPVDWLEAGGEATKVAQLAQELGSGL
ncbi:MAG TPA: hypothetical protein VE010_18420 [Thermoanaerobaculia bacterium]|nr:hypothetical protein [Thermoanaerobaculia bacterium]